MATKYLILLGVVCLVLCLGFLVCVDGAHAQGKSIASKKDGELGNKEFDQDQLPGKLEIGLGVGSIFVMIAVVKYV